MIQRCSNFHSAREYIPNTGPGDPVNVEGVFDVEPLLRCLAEKGVLLKLIYGARGAP